MNLTNRLLYLVFFYMLTLSLSAQDRDSVTVLLPDSAVSAFPVDSLASASAKDTVVRSTRVYLIHADSLSFDRERNADAQVLNGNVCFRHDSAYMYCDSAYFFESTNSLEAFDNVRMEQGDTLFVFGDYLFYDGNRQVAYLRDNVRMENGQVTLFTDSLNYERFTNIGYYFEGGMIVDSLNQLSSFYGQYSPDTKWAYFNDSVRLENERFTLYSDTLHYNTESKLANILGPSVIVSDSGEIRTSKGWYDTVRNTSFLLDRSEVQSGSRILIGDSIAYDREQGFGEVFGNMCLVDTSRLVTLEGQYGFYNERTEYAFATDSARFLEYSQGDTLYLHADTLEMRTLGEADSLYREIKAYYGVRFYRDDLQGVCDSMLFDTRDTVLYMFKDPIIWNEQYQMYGDTILIYMNDSTIDHAHVRQFAMAAQYVDTTYYNQLKGNDLKAFFEGSAVRRIDVAGSAESIFYPVEDDGAMVGLNETKSGFMTIWVKDNKLERLKIWPTPTGSLTPIPDLKPDMKFLKDFYWFDYIRPKNKDDIYQVVKRKAAEVPKRSNKFVH